MNPIRRSPLVSKSQKRLSNPSERFVARLPDRKTKKTASPQQAPAARISKSEKSRDSILVAAAKLFRRQGYSATTLRQIAESPTSRLAASTTTSIPRRQILDEVLHLGLLSVFEAVKKAHRDAGPVSHRRKIGLAIEAHLVALLEASDFTSANIRIYGQLPETLKKPHRPLRRAYAKYWDKLFLDARRAGEIRADIEIVPLRIFVLGALNWTIEWFSLDSKDAVLKLARRTELLIFDGVED